MNRVATLMALVLVLLMVRGQAFVWYAINFDYIAEELCVNPETSCNGLCQLAEQVSQDVPLNENSVPFIPVEEVVWSVEQQHNLPHIPGFTEINKSDFVYDYGQILDPNLGRLFRPPKQG